MYVYYDPILPSVTYDIQRQKVLDADAVAPLRDALLVSQHRVCDKPPALVLQRGPSPVGGFRRGFVFGN
jgi:hypothetical protein